jgi:iron(III)-enterobactin esterase
VTSSLRVLKISFVAALAASACSSPANQPPFTGAAGTSSAGAAGASDAGSNGSAAGTTGGGAGTSSTATAGTSGSGGAGSFGTAGGGAGTTIADGGAGTGSDAALDTGGVPDPGTMGDGDFTIMSPYADAPELTPNAAVPHGTVSAFTIASSESPIFPGVTGAYTRQGWMYVPKQYVKGTPAPFVIVQDGRDYMTKLPVVLDNMIAAKRLPVMLAIMVMAGPGDGPGSERGWEYDTVSTDFVDWVESTVLPKMTKLYGVAFTTNPEGRSSLGGSSGASAAFTMAWFRPDLYRKVVSYSGTFTAQGKTTAYPDGAWAYPDHLVAQTPAKPIRMYMEVADMDAGATNTLASMKNWILANQMMAAALKTQGYHYHFDYAKGAVHNDTHVVNQTLPSVLEWLWRGYPIN